MGVDPGPLTLVAVVSTWHPDLTSATVIVVVAAAYAWCYRRARSTGQLRPAQAWCFWVGIALWALATIGAIGAYAYSLFWMRALQVLMLLYVVPLFVALSKPVTAARGALGPAGRDRIDRFLATPFARVLVHPLTTSLAMLGTPWLLYLTPWYTASLESEWIGAPTRILLVAIGFAYFYARLQSDPVPHRYPQLISLLITIGEALGDGVLGLVIWQGSLIGTAYYSALHRSWGPDQRLDQTIGAGVLWILGDLVGWPFALLLMRALSRDEKAHAAAVDAELDAAEAADTETADTETADKSADTETPAASGLWWENDPELRERFRRR